MCILYNKNSLEIWNYFYFIVKLRRLWQYNFIVKRKFTKPSLLSHQTSYLPCLGTRDSGLSVDIIFDDLRQCEIKKLHNY